MALGHVIVLLQHEWPRGENLFLKAINKICQQGNFQYENFFNYVTSILFQKRTLAGLCFQNLTEGNGVCFWQMLDESCNKRESRRVGGKCMGTG